MSTVRPKTMQTVRTEPLREALRGSVAGIVAACVLSLMQVRATRREGRFSIDTDAEW
jgi:hypothetical protein